VIAELRDRVLPSWTPTTRAPALTVYFEEEPGPRESRRIAANIAKLPELVWWTHDTRPFDTTRRVTA